MDGWKDRKPAGRDVCRVPCAATRISKQMEWRVEEGRTAIFLKKNTDAFSRREKNHQFGYFTEASRTAELDGPCGHMADGGVQCVCSVCKYSVTWYYVRENDTYRNSGNFHRPL